jgi:RHS repeat-associated protein
VYDGCGSLKQDKNKGIALIDYDFNGMPTRIQFRNGNVTEYTYSAEGAKLRTVHRTAVSGLTVAYGSRHTLTASETLSVDSTLYVGNFEIDGNYCSKYYFANGYIDMGNTGSGTYHYTITDHLGNVRAVVDENGTLKQVNNYFAYGGLLNDVTTGADVQTHKYNGKELDRMHGLDTYDYGARNYDAVLGQFNTMDPLCEKYYHVSPYVYCGGNPVNRVDVDGMDIWELSVNGQITWKEKSENHQLVALDEKGNRTNNSITVTDRSILDQLSENREGTDSNYAITQLSEVSTVFLFAANNSNVEWSLSGYNNGKKKIYVLGTDYSDDSVTPDMGVKYAHFKESDMLFDVHSHPSVKDDVRGASGGDRGKNSYYGDMKGITFRYYRFRDNYKTSLPPHYVYHKKSRNLYNYTPWESSIYIKHIKSHNGLNFLIPPKK